MTDNTENPPPLDLHRVEKDWRRRIHQARQPKWTRGPFRSPHKTGFTLRDMAEAHRLATQHDSHLFRSLLHCAETHNTVGATVLMNCIQTDEWSRRTGHKIVPRSLELRAHLERHPPKEGD